MRLKARMVNVGQVRTSGGVFIFRAARDVKKGDDVLMELETGAMASPQPGKRPRGWQRIQGRYGAKAKWLEDVKAGEEGRVKMPPRARRGRLV